MAIGIHRINVALDWLCGIYRQAFPACFSFILTNYSYLIKSCAPIFISEKKSEVIEGIVAAINLVILFYAN